MDSCSSCGSPIPPGQGSSCSMCYGDPFYGRDGYMLAYIAQQEQEDYYRRMDADRERELEAQWNAHMDEQYADFLADERAALVADDDGMRVYG